ncbi:MAG: hypothetical protein U0234_30645 [Sandaracinus sp.]
MDPILDPRCLMTTEALVVDGANGVCHEPRLEARRPPGAASLFALFFVVGALSWFARDRMPVGLRRGLLVLALAVAALPGFWALLSVRADAPSLSARSARRLARTHDEIAAFATEHECAWVRTEGSIAALPVARFALVGHRCAHPAPIDLFADALESGCTEAEDGSLACGTVDDDSRLPEQRLPPSLPLPPDAPTRRATPSDEEGP